MRRIINPDPDLPKEHTLNVQTLATKNYLRAFARLLFHLTNGITVVTKARKKGYMSLQNKSKRKR